MRAFIAALILATAPATLAAQGWIVPRNCFRPTCPPGVACARPPEERVCPPVGASNVVRTSSHVRAQLEKGVLRYEVEETFLNRGGRVGEADYLFPLPQGAAFQDLKLSINGELVAGETMNAAEARRIYEEIVRRQKDPALVEWMGYGLLRTRIFPINPGEEKRVVVRFQTLAEREGVAVRIDYFRGARGADASPQPVARRQEGDGWRTRESRITFTLTSPKSEGYAQPY